jgi:spore maturation protein CgeB
MTRILVIHPGHGHSTTDVYHGLCVGLEMNGVEVVRFEWGQMLRPLTAAVLGAVQGGVVKERDAERLHQFMCWLAGADALAMAADTACEAVLVVNGLLFPPSRAELFKKIGVPIACYGTEAPYFAETERQLVPSYTHWFTQERTAVRRYADLGVPATYLPMAYNPRVHTPGAPDPDRICDVVFVGGGYPERKHLLDGVDWTGINRAVHGTLWRLDLDTTRDQDGLTRGVRFAEGAIPNEITTAWHRSAAIALNMHRRTTYIERRASLPDGAAESLGPRSYEIPACGGFLLSDDERPELRDVYGDSAAMFRAWDAGDLERRIRYWLAHPDERERTRQAQAEAVAPHHWGNRAKTILECIID